VINGEFLCRMEEILDLYNEPYNPKRPVLCFDEMPYQLLSDVIEPMPVMPGKAKRYDYHYERNGVCNILCAYEPHAGKRIIKLTRNRRRQDYAWFMKKIAECFPDAEIIRVVQDNLNTHSGGSFYETFDSQTAQRLYKRFEFHFTPKKASWLNMVEFEFSAISRQCLNRRIGNIATLLNEICTLVKIRNETHTQVNWKFSKNDARKKFKRFYKND